MNQKIKPTWTKKEQKAGQQLGQSWDEYFSAREKISSASGQPHSELAEDGRIADLQARIESKILAYPNVVGVSPGIRTKRGKPTGEPCLVVLVERKIPRSKLLKHERLPRKLEGVLVDVVEVGKVEALSM